MKIGLAKYAFGLATLTSGGLGLYGARTLSQAQDAGMVEIAQVCEARPEICPPEAISMSFQLKSVASTVATLGLASAVSGAATVALALKDRKINKLTAPAKPEQK